MSSAFTPTVLSVRPAPNVQTFLSGSGTYTTPTNAVWLHIRMVGGGSGGQGGGASGGGGAGGNGVASTFGSSLLTAGGGVAGPTGNQSLSVGGVSTIASPAAGLTFVGGASGSLFAVPSTYAAGQMGGATIFGAGGAAVVNEVGKAAAANSGGGGGGGSSDQQANQLGGSGGGGGGGIDAIISSPAASYSYAVGTGGAGGAAGSGGRAGGAGGSGAIIVIAYFA